MMIIDFNNMERTMTPGFKGGEGALDAAMFADSKVRIIHGRLAPGSSAGPHSHETNCEVIYVLSGVGDFICDGKEKQVGPGGCHYCPAGHGHAFANNGNEDLVFFAVVAE